MPYLGRKGASAPLTSADIPDSSITTAKIVDGTVAEGDLAFSTATQAELDAQRTNSSITTLGTVTAGDISHANIVYPAGHVLQMKVRTLTGTVISGASGTFTPVSATDITVNRTSGTQLLFTLSGGGGYTSAAGRTLRTLGKRTSGTSFSGTEEELGNATYGNSRLYLGADAILIPYSSVAIDSESISGNYTYRWFYKGDGGSVEFSGADRGDITITIMEFKHS